MSDQVSMLLAANEQEGRRAGRARLPGSGRAAHARDPGHRQERRQGDAPRRGPDRHRRNAHRGRARDQRDPARARRARRDRLAPAAPRSAILPTSSSRTSRRCSNRRSGATATCSSTRCLLVMSRLGAPWQLIRLAIQAAGSDVAARVAETPFAVAVEIVLTDIERMIATLARQRQGRAQRRGRDAPQGRPRRRARACAPSSIFSVGFRLGAPARRVPLRSLQAAAGRDREPSRPGAPRAASASRQGDRAECDARRGRRRRDRGQARARRRLPQLCGRACASARRRGASIPSCRTISTPARRS